MDAFSSSSFLSTLPISFPKNKSPSPPNLTILNVSSVRIEEKTVTTTKQTPRPAEQTRKPPPPRKAAAVSRRPAAEVSLPTLIFNGFDEFINTFIDPPVRQSVDPRHVLSANFAPVDELPPTECEVVEGALPSCLDGAYIRNGPNPQYLPRGPYHLFDGDGMLHAVRISQGRATLCSRYVKTYKYEVERSIGSPVIPNVFSGFSGLTASAARGALTAARALSGQFNPGNGIGLANTSLALFGGKLFALGESDLPYAVKISPDGDVITLGRHDFDGKLIMSMTAHPKIDPETREAFAFRYGPMPPFLTFFRVNPDGVKQPDVPIFSMPTPSFMHDFAITKNYAIFSDIQIGMNPLDLLNGGSPVGTSPGKVPRVGVIPRYAKDESEMRWFEVPGFNIVHAINAWEEDEGNTIVMVAPNIMSVEHTMERMDLVHAAVEKLTINLKTGMVFRQPLSTRNLDFGVINPAYVAKKNNSTGVADNCVDIYPAEVVAATTGELHHAATATAPHHWSSPAIITTTKAANSPRFAHRRRPPTSPPPAAVAAAASPPSHSTTMITMVFTTAATTLLSLPPPTKKSQTRQNEEEDSSSSTMVVLIVDVVPPFGKHKATVACWTSSPPLVTANKSDSGNPTLRRNYDDGELGAASQVAISSIVFRRSPPPSPPLFFVSRSPGRYYLHCSRRPQSPTSHSLSLRLLLSRSKQIG